MICSLRDIPYDGNGQIERPTLLLTNTDESIIGTLGDAYHIGAKLCFNDMSELSFELPSSSPYYNSITGYKYVIAKPFGKFIIIGPQEQNDGVQKTKSVTAYSAEYELTKKRLVIPGGTYNFNNSIDETDTIVSILEETAPSWTVVYVSDSLTNKFRTFDDVNTSMYDFMMNTLQEKYGCCFCFDSMNRYIYVYDADSIGKQVPIYLSLDNLAQKIEVSELTQEVVTSLYVTGADGIDIRSMNPMGTNRIYNLDHMFRDGNCSSTLVQKWNLWKENFSSYQTAYKNLRSAYNVANAELQGEAAKLVDLQSKLASLEDIQATLIDHIASGANRGEELAQKTAEIEAKQREVESKKLDIETRQAEVDRIAGEMRAINERTAFSNFFSASEWKQMQNFILEDQLQDTTFVASSSNAYNEPDVIGVYNGSFSVSSSTIETSSVQGLTLYDMTGGKISVSMTSSKIDENGNSVSGQSVAVDAEIVHGVFQIRGDTGYVVMSLYLNKNTTSTDGDSAEYPSGNLTIVGKSYSFSHSGSGIYASMSGASMYLTRNVTEYQTRSIEEDLYSYSVSVLDRISEPEYEFSVDSVNFLFAPEYEAFKKVLELGSSLYLDTGSGVVTPLLLEIQLNYDDLTSYSMTFCNKFRRSKGASRFIDMLEDMSHSVSSTDFSKFNYDRFVNSGAESAVRNFMNSALDASKNMLVASDKMKVEMDHTGLHLRKEDTSNASGYDDRQIWMLNNLIAYTDDGFSSVKMALGQFYDQKSGKSCFGIVAPNIVGTLLAGEALTIESAKTDSSGIAQFKADGTGVHINNATLTMRCDSTSTTAKGEVVLDPKYGFAIGEVGMLSVDDDGVTYVNKNKYKLYLDTSGNVHFKGTLEGADGSFSGTLAIGGSTSNPNFYVDASGNLAIGGTTKLSTGSANPNANIYMSAGGASRFRGIVNASDLQINGRSVLDSAKSMISAAMLNLKGASVQGSDGSYFSVDGNGNVKIKGDIAMGPGTKIYWQGYDQSVSNVLDGINRTAGEAYEAASTAESKASQAGSDAAADLVRVLANGGYGGTFINGTSVNSPVINGGTINGGTMNSASVHVYVSDTDKNETDRQGYFIHDDRLLIGSIVYSGIRSNTNYSSRRAMFIKTENDTSIKIESPKNNRDCGVSIEGHHVFVGNSDQYYGSYVSLKAENIEIWGNLKINDVVYGSGGSGSSGGGYAVFA